MASSGRLTAIKVEKLKEPGRYGDGGNLWLQVSKWGTKSWIFRYNLGGRERHMGLGDFPTLSLAEAREKALAARKLVKIDGIDPIEQRRQAKEAKRIEDASRITFRAAAERYIAAHESSWRNPIHRAQWPSTLDRFAYAVIGDLPVSSVTTAHVMQILEPIWQTRTETASRTRGRIEAVLDWATARHYRTGENPARWRGHLDKLLPAKTKVRKVRHQPAMAIDEVPGFIAELRRSEFVSARALEFTILCAARTGEVIGAKWSEIDLAAKVWTIPGERMKSGREHRVPLSGRAIELLGTVPRVVGCAFVFPGARAGHGLSNMAMLECLREMRGRSVSVHGFRSTFRDWAGERTNFPREIAEAALAHVLGDKTEAAYRRGDALEKRRRLMEAWAGFCDTPRAATDSAKVLALARA